jgi:hypothetical protein
MHNSPEHIFRLEHPDQNLLQRSWHVVEHVGKDDSNVDRPSFVPTKPKNSPWNTSSLTVYSRCCRGRTIGFHEAMNATVK